MGKQQRRRKGGKKGNSPGVQVIQSDHSDKGACNSTGSSSLINKIRHGDVKIRHGALSSLSSTIFSPESLSKSKSIKFELIQAISERIMDEDVPCALCAVGCIANYILFQDAGNNQSKVDDHRLETMLAPILVTKMNKASDQIKSTHGQMVKVATEMLVVRNDDEDSSTASAKQQNKAKKNESSPLKKIDQMARMMMDQFSIISLSLHVFCGLVEIFSVNNSSSSLLNHQRDQFLSALINALIISSEMICSLTNASIATSDNSSNVDHTIVVNKMIAKYENEANVIADVAVYAARTIHSSSDDNLDFVKAIMSSGNSWDVILSAISNNYLPTLSRLHCAGIVITSRQVIMDAGADDSTKFPSNLEMIVTTQILSLLSQCTMYSTDISSALCNQIEAMESKLHEERKDQEMEDNVIKMVNKRKESARLIARRQKEMTRPVAKTTCESGQDDDMEPNQNVDTAISEEIEDRYDKAVNAWKNACLPLKLSIEVIANLCADRGSQDQNDDFDDIEDAMGWDSDKEEKLLASGANDAGYKHKHEEVELFKKITAHGIPDRVISVFGSILLYLLDSTDGQIPQVALDDLFEILEKCSICLGNIICNLDDWKANDTDISIVWKEFFQCLTAATDGEVSFAHLKLPCQAVSALLSTMVAFLRFRPTLGNLVNEQDLNLLLSFASMETPIHLKQSDSNYIEAIVTLQKDAIILLGMLCSEPHPDEVNERVCLVLLQVLNRGHSVSASLMCEILNVLMDMYSADEGDPNNHESIFKKNKVLVTFEKNLPVLKRKCREATKPSQTEIAYWNETALNASRFINYKK